jgi:RecG-like helicase
MEEKQIKDPFNVSWFKRNWIGILILGVIFIIVIGIISHNNSSNQGGGQGSQTTQLTSNISLQQLVDFYNNKFTDRQKQEYFDNNLKGKYVTWEFYVKNIASDNAEYPLLGSASQYSMNSDVGVAFEASEMSKLSQISKGDLITVYGQVVDNKNIFGNIFYLNNAKILG